MQTLGSMKELWYVSVPVPQVTPAGIDALKKALPKAQIVQGRWR
jgi:hypothetical protein